MLTLHIGPAVSEKTGTVIKGFSFIVMGDNYWIFSVLVLEITQIHSILTVAMVTALYTSKKPGIYTVFDSNFN